MRDEEYFALDCISQSDINLFIKNKQEYALSRQVGRSGSTKAMDLGSLNHTLLFEPEEFHNRYAHFSGTVPNSPQMKKFFEYMMDTSHNLSIGDMYCNCYSSKGKDVAKESQALYDTLIQYKEFMRENGHKNMITEELELQSRRMIEIVHLHPGVQKTLLAGRANTDKYLIYKEVGITWYSDVVPGIPLKSKVDEVHVDTLNCIAYAYDYKTTRTPNAKSFRSSVKYYGYDIQESFYAEALKFWLYEKYGKHFQIIFRFIPQYNVAPFNVLGVVQFSDVDRDNAYNKWADALIEMVKCIETGQFDNTEAYSEDGITHMKLDDTPVMILEGEAY